jgi:hypothetical protein
MHFYRIAPARLSVVYLGKKSMPRCRWASPIRNYPEEENMLACLHLGIQPQTMHLTLLLLPPASSPTFVCRTKAVFDLGRFVSSARHQVHQNTESNNV